MEQDFPGLDSKAKVNAIAQGSDSSCITCASKGINRQGRRLTSKFKGVVPQQNGHWGAQMYANHQRIWLGTFKSEKEAAMAYDSAAIRIRSGDSAHRNFPWTKITVEEPNFQKLHSTEALLSMLKDGSYQTKFSEYLWDRSESGQAKAAGTSAAKSRSNGGTSSKQLFQKVLTPSDVGKLNRLVIPKKHAVKYLPEISASAQEITEGEEGEQDLQLVFYDRMMRQWKFRYCYWKSSQSYVFTRGWNRFVKEKELKANDTIAFYMYEVGKGSDDGAETAFYVVDVKNNSNSSVSSLVESESQSSEMQLLLELGHEIAQRDIDDKDNEELESSQHLEKKIQPNGNEVKGFKLFGVHIK